MEQRVYRDTDIIFVSASNAAELEGLINPSLMICEEAGTLTTASMLIPLTTFHDWVGFYMIGDPRQLSPVLLALLMNEWQYTAVISAISNWDKKGNKQFFLDTQYRMNPETCAFINAFFYEGNIKSHPSTYVNNEVRDAIRRVSLSYGLKGTEKKGVCYWVMDLPLGVSRREAGSMSLINYAHIDGIKDLVKRALEAGVHHDMISILSFYAGQRSAVTREVRATINGELILKPYKDNSTVDSFQGKENRFIILDLVIADEITGKRNTSDKSWAEKEFLHTLNSKFGIPTAHMKNGHRLVVGSTRQNDGLVIFTQGATLLRASRVSESTSTETVGIAAVVRDADERGILVTCPEFHDTHPSSEWEKQRMTKQEREAEKRLRVEQKNFYISEHRPNRRRHAQATPFPVPKA